MKTLEKIPEDTLPDFVGRIRNLLGETDTFFYFVEGNLMVDSFGLYQVVDPKITENIAQFTRKRFSPKEVDTKDIVHFEGLKVSDSNSYHGEYFVSGQERGTFSLVPYASSKTMDTEVSRLLMNYAL